MKSIYERELFKKNILVKHDDSKNNFESLFALANLFNIKVIKNGGFADYEHVRLAKEIIGEQYRVPSAFYRGFPQTVRELSPDQLLFDQILHYTRTYGFGDFSGGHGSVMEKEFTRLAFREDCEIKEFSIVAEEEAIELVKEIAENYLASSRPLSLENYDFVKAVTLDFNYIPRQITSKNTAVKLLIDLRNIDFCKFINTTDVIKVVEEINYLKYANTKINKLNFRNQDRKFIASVIRETLKRYNRISTETKMLQEVFEKRKVWKGLLHHIHFSPKTETEFEFCYYIRSKEVPNISAYSQFERLMNTGRPDLAVIFLKERKGEGAILRNLDYILSRCKNVEQIGRVVDNIKGKNGIILFQLLNHYSLYSYDRRTFTFTKFYKMRRHVETQKEMNKRKSSLSKVAVDLLKEEIRKKLEEYFKGKLGKVYIDQEMKDIALPLQDTTSQGGYGVLPKGSVIHIPRGKKIRAFTYWEKVDDIDLSCIGLNKDGSQSEFSWRTMARNQSKAICYSGDVTNGYHGGAEYFDIDTDVIKEMYPDMEYIVFCDNVYSGVNFDKCICRAGYMLRDKVDSGEIFEPKTVQSSFTINCESTFAYLFAINLYTNDFVWLNTARDSNCAVAGTQKLDFLKKYILATEVMNLYDFMSMAATEVVDDVNEADIIVSDRFTTETDKEVVHSCDVDKMLKYMNM